ncbi:uncharacterized protein [Ptychodera flava]|uniref:uncharacterized protein n=1 Tax=Ptychodera flava TaxID=63121 RepID=UPI003969D81A
MSDVSVCRNFLFMNAFPLGTSLRLLTVTIIAFVSLLAVAMTAPTGTNSCRTEDYKYFFDPLCCRMCPSGHKVESHCTSSNSASSCVPCPDGYFQSDWSGDTHCTLIDKCDKRFEHVSKLASLDRTTNNECACDVGYKYTSTQELCIEAPDEQQTPLPVPKEHSTQELPLISQHVLPPVVTQEYSTAADRQTSTYPSAETSTVLPLQPADNDLTDEIKSNQKKINILFAVIIIVICTAVVVALILVIVCCIKGLYCFKKCRTKAATNTANNREGPLPINNGAGDENIPMLGSTGNNQSLGTAAASTNIATSGGDAPPGSDVGGEEIALVTTEQPESSRNDQATETVEDADDEGCATRSTVSRAESTESVESHPERSSSESGICREDSIEGQDLNSSSPDVCYSMTEKHRAILRNSMTYIVENLPVSPVLDRMPSFTEEDVAKIKCHTEYEQRRQLIYTLMTKGPDALMSL